MFDMLLFFKFLNGFINCLPVLRQINIIVSSGARVHNLFEVGHKVTKYLLHSAFLRLHRAGNQPCWWVGDSYNDIVSCRRVVVGSDMVIEHSVDLLNGVYKGPQMGTVGAWSPALSMLTGL